jgi:hypothetical protein
MAAAVAVSSLAEQMALGVLAQFVLFTPQPV